MPRVEVYEARLRIEGNQRGVGTARREYVPRLAFHRAIEKVGKNRAAGPEIDVRGPVDLDVRVRCDRLAVGAIQHVEEAVLMGVDEHLAHLAVDAEFGEQAFGGRVEVEAVVRHGLVIPDHFTGLGPERESTGGIQTIGAVAKGGVVRLGIPGADIQQVELRVIRSVLPSRPAAVLPRVRLGLVRPGLGTRFAGRGNRVPAPQLLPGIRIVGVDAAARGAVAARHPRDQHPVRNDGRNDAFVAFFPIGILLLPDLLAGLHVEREYVRVDRLAKELALVDRRRASHERSAGRDSQRASFVLDGRAPYLPARRDVDGKGPVAVDHVHDAVVNGRLRVLAHVVREAEAPDRNQASYVGLVDLLERAVHLQVVAHAEGGDVFGVPPVAEQLLRRLGESEPAPGIQQCREYFLHDRPLLSALLYARARARETGSMST